MNANAIVYTSNTGYTAQYAKLLGEKTGLPVYSLAEAGAKLPAGNCVIYLGWLMAGKVQGYAKAAKRYRVAAVCGVGMGASGSQLADVRKANSLGDALPLFTLQGGFHPEKLNAGYRLMMRLMRGVLIRQIAGKPERTPEDEDLLDLLEHGGDRVSEANLAQPLAWLAAQEG